MRSIFDNPSDINFPLNEFLNSISFSLSDYGDMVYYTVPPPTKNISCIPQPGKQCSIMVHPILSKYKHSPATVAYIDILPDYSKHPITVESGVNSQRRYQSYDLTYCCCRRFEPCSAMKREQTKQLICFL